MATQSLFLPRRDTGAIAPRARCCTGPAQLHASMPPPKEITSSDNKRHIFACCSHNH
jgi:hypothetical protein